MAEVRDFQAYQRKRKQDASRAGRAETRAETASEKDAKTSGSRRFFGTGAAIGVLLIAIVSLLSYTTFRSRAFTDATVTAEAPIVMAQDAKTLNLGGLVLMYSRDGAGCMDTEGHTVWNQTYQMQAPIAKICKDTVAIADYNGQSIYVANKEHILGEIKTGLPIRSFSVASQGVVAAILDDTDVTRIILFDTEGNELVNFRTTMGESGYPLSLAISPDGQLVAISYLNTLSAEIQTNIAFYNFGSVGQNKTDNLVGGYTFHGAIAPLIRFLDNRSAYAVCTDQIVFFAGDQVPKQSSQTSFSDAEVIAAYEDARYTGLIFASDKGESAYRLDVYDSDGRKLFEKPLNKHYANAVFRDGYLVLYDSEEWKIMGMDGSDRYEGSFDSEVKLILPTKLGFRYLLVTANAIQTVELK